MRNGETVSTLTLTAHQAEELLGLTGGNGPVVVTVVARENHVWHLRQGEDGFFLKTHTKDWYQGGVVQLGACVRHEAVAYEILAAHDISAPDVVLAETDNSNPFGRPFLLTRALAGTSLTPLLRQHTGDQFARLLEAAGSYLRRVHEITFRFPGYLMELAGPDTPPDPNAWEHPIWTARQAQADALALLDADRPRLSRATARRVEAVFADLSATLEPIYRPPRFTHGDCHVGQFYLAAGADGWAVTGFVDMEVASAGAPEYDLIKFALEMMSHFSPETQWWLPLFAGYGREPDFAQFRLLLLTSSEASFKAHGEEHWPATREATLANLLAARDWRSLFTKPR